METCAELVRKKRGNSLPAILSSYFPSIFPKSARSIPLFILSYSFPNVGYLSIKFVRILSRGTIWLLSRKVASSRNLISAQTFSFVLFFSFFFFCEILITISWGINFITKERVKQDFKICLFLYYIMFCNIFCILLW